MDAVCNVNYDSAKVDEHLDKTGTSVKYVWMCTSIVFDFRGTFHFIHLYGNYENVYKYYKNELVVLMLLTDLISFLVYWKMFTMLVFGIIIFSTSSAKPIIIFCRLIVTFCHIEPK